MREEVPACPPKVGQPYGVLIRNLRKITNGTLNKEPKWRVNDAGYHTGYDPNRPAKLHPL